jgi:long-chain acyl-CoA synthetase
VYSAEVEAALADHDAVLEAAVFGIPDDRWGEAVHAVVTVTTEDAVTASELDHHRRERIAGFKVPQSMDLTTAPLPKSGAGKVLKHRLRDPYWEARGRSVN